MSRFFGIFLGFFGMFCLCLLCAPAAPLRAADKETPEALLAQVERNYGRMRSLECAFTQKSKSGGRVREGRGRAFFFRPGDGDGVIRWEYLEPDAQTIINDGKEIRMYMPADKQLLISPAAAMDADMAYALFTGRSGLGDTFRVADGAAADIPFLGPPREDQDKPRYLRVLALEPKEPQSQLKRAWVWVNADQRIERLLMEDHFEALTEITLSDLVFDAIKPTDAARIAELRELKIDAETEIIRQ